jgi:hypothetical protein
MPPVDLARIRFIAELPALELFDIDSYFTVITRIDDLLPRPCPAFEAVRVSKRALPARVERPFCLIGNASRRRGHTWPAAAGLSPAAGLPPVGEEGEEGHCRQDARREAHETLWRLRWKALRPFV